MSAKKTPVYVRTQKTNNLLSLDASQDKSTPTSMRRKIISKAIVNDTMCEESYSNPLNTAFTKSAHVRVKPSGLNACYTPTSLFRSAKATPNKFFNVADVSVSTPRSTKKCSVISACDDKATDSNMTVAVRVRPLNSQECMRPSITNIVQVSDNELTVYAGTNADYSAGVTHSFIYDHVFYSCNSESQQFASQQTVFEETTLPLIDRAFEGYNACLFAYGQTGSGKSFSMMGIDSLDESVDTLRQSEAGIIPRFCHELFQRIELVKERLQVEIEVSYFEIYNEKIHDLLCVSQVEALCSGVATPSQRQALKVREHPIWGPYVVDLSVHTVDTYETLRNWLAVGNSQRATAATGMNDKSSRSHSIFNIVLNISELDSPTSIDSTPSNSMVRQTRRSKISLVDLAGSERISASGTNGDRIREGVSINKSLLTLGKVIAALSNAKKNSNFFVPYRESVLTWLLRENLGGNSKTVMLATISPASVHTDETLATLRYACQARTIVNRVKVNESPHDRIIRELREEVDRLKSLRQDYERQKRLSANNNFPPRKIIIETAADETEVDALRQQLAEREKELQRAQKSWMERLKEAESHRKSEICLLKQKGLALELSDVNKQMCLINLAADPILSGTLFYILPPGTVKIGRSRNASVTSYSQAQILLDGPLVGSHHCTIENMNSMLFIIPENEDFETYLNGELVCDKQSMFHGDRLVIGGSHYFRISNPRCAKREHTQIVDFQFAHHEILQKQEEKLRQQLNDEKRLALSQIEMERMENERNYMARMDMLEMEKFKFKCNKEILETERKALAEKHTLDNSLLSFTPSFKSTLLDDIKRIIQQPSEESLHKTQLMVKEATQRCRNLDLGLEFKQSQVLDEFGMFRTVILILDKRNKMKAEWPTARLGVWLDMMRHDAENIENIFSSVDIEWQPLESALNETFNESLNSSKISLNLSIVKEGILKQPLTKLAAKRSPSDINDKGRYYFSKVPHLAESKHASLNSRKMLTYEHESPAGGGHSDTEASDCAFASSAVRHIIDIERSTLLLKELCESSSSNVTKCTSREFVNTTGQKTIQNSVQRLEAILQEMRSCLDPTVCADSNNDVSVTSTPKSVKFLID